MGCVMKMRWRCSVIVGSHCVTTGEPLYLRRADLPAHHQRRRRAADRRGRLSSGLRELEGLADWVLVEGAGGWFTPLSDSLTFADWAQAEQLPVILVVGVKLGCINHAMLTAQAVRRADYRWRGGSPMTYSPGQAPRRISGDAEKPTGRAVPRRNTVACRYRAARRSRPVSGPQGAGSGVIHCASSGSSSAIISPSATLRPRCKTQKRSATRRIKGRCCSASSTVRPISRFNRNSRSASFCRQRGLCRARVHQDQ